MIHLDINYLDTQISKVIYNDKNFSFDYISNSIDDTKNLAYVIAKYLKVGNIIVLNGELGSGKTVFVTDVAKYFGIEDQVCSPTFTIVNEYELKDNNKLYHFDVYRIENSTDFCDSIGTEYFNNGICIIEWGNIIKDILPKNTIYIDIIKDSIDENKRYFKIWR